MRSDLFSQFLTLDVDPAIARLYHVADPVGRASAHFHGALNGLFVFMNNKSKTNKHFNAAESRELIDLIEQIRSTQAALKEVGVNLELRDDYEKITQSVEPFLLPSGGSAIPDDFQNITIVKYEPVFFSSETEIVLADHRQRVPIRMVGEGAFAIVYRYTDVEYGKTFAIKRAKKGLSAKELLRFRREFEILYNLSFPYILEAYRYNEERADYTMEFCDSTLEAYIEARNDRLSFEHRRRIALQFLYALNYLHRKDILHRDISRRNILVKIYDEGAAIIKLSDFGLAKDVNEQITRSDSETRGSIIDPTLHSFKRYGVINEVYPIGHVLSFIFSGRKSLNGTTGPVRAIVDKCVTHDLPARYQDVLAIIRDVESLKPDMTGSTKPPPA